MPAVEPIGKLIWKSLSYYSKWYEVADVDDKSVMPTNPELILIDETELNTNLEQMRNIIKNLDHSELE